MEDDEMNEKCSMHGRNKKYNKILVGESEDKGPFWRQRHT
jgi:hypothetical protein